MGKLQTIQVSQQERWEASKHQVHKNKAKYNRKPKYKPNYLKDDE